MNFAAKYVPASHSISIHVRGCNCLNMNGRKAPVIELEATTVQDAIREADESEDATARGMKVRAAACTKEPK
jgi:hypothetical protein